MEKIAKKDFYAKQSPAPLLIAIVGGAVLLFCASLTYLFRGSTFPYITFSATLLLLFLIPLLILTARNRHATARKWADAELGVLIATGPLTFFMFWLTNTSIIPQMNNSNGMFFAIGIYLFLGLGIATIAHRTGRRYMTFGILGGLLIPLLLLGSCFYMLQNLKIP